MQLSGSATVKLTKQLSNIIVLKEKWLALFINWDTQKKPMSLTFSDNDVVVIFVIISRKTNEF